MQEKVKTLVLDWDLTLTVHNGFVTPTGSGSKDLNDYISYYRKKKYFAPEVSKLSNSNLASMLLSIGLQWKVMQIVLNS